MWRKEYEITRAQIMHWREALRYLRHPSALILTFVESKLTKFLDSNSYERYRIIIEADEQEKERMPQHVSQE